MTRSTFIFVSLAILASFYVTLNTAAHLEIDPSNFDPLTGSTVKISCTPEDVTDKKPSQVALIEIFRGENNLIASVSQNKTINSPTADKKYQVDGQIDENGENSFLKVTLLHPVEEDSGQYRCVIYLGASLHREEDVQSLTVYAISKKIQALRERVVALEKLLAESDKEETGINKRLAFMENKMDEHRQTIDDFRDKVQFKSAFAATISKPTPYKPGKVLVFDKVVTSIGKHYNPKTGIFTAPTDGLYFFYVTLGTSTKGTAGYSSMVVNGKKTIAYIGIGALAFVDENSVSTSVELKAKDTVSIKMAGTSNIDFFKDQGISNFGGYCVKAY